MTTRHPSILRSILVGGLAAGILDAVDAIVAFKLVLGFDPIPIYQFVASGLLGPSAFAGGVGTALVGLVFHFLIAFTAAAVFSHASVRWPGLRQNVFVYGAAFGVGVYAVMNYVVIPMSRIPPSPFSVALFLNGVIGHALFVGLPIAFAARHYLGQSVEPKAAKPALRAA